MTPLEELITALGEAAVSRDPASLAAAARDRSENPPGAPEAVVHLSNLHDLRLAVGIAARARVPVVPRVRGTNLTFPPRGGWVLDLASMNRILEIDERNQVVVIEPGVTFAQLHEVLDRRRTGLTIGLPLAPPETSIVASCLVDGLGNQSLRHGVMGEWLTGLEVVRADGTMLRTGAWAAGSPPFARAPLPDLTGLFVSMQGGTGIVSKAAVRLWPAPAARERCFLLFFERHDALRVLADLPRLDILDDASALFWPALKMLLGVHAPKTRDAAEPEVVLHLDLGASDHHLLAAKRSLLDRQLARAARAGIRFEGPLGDADLCAIEPRLAGIAEFPARLALGDDDGLTWVGAYGPVDGVADACDGGIAILADHGFPPLIITRPMKGGHFAVVRFIEAFHARDEAERARVVACNHALCEMLRGRGFIIFRTPGLAIDRYREHLDPGFARLLGEVKQLLDPDGIMNPGRWSGERPGSGS